MSSKLPMTRMEATRLSQPASSSTLVGRCLGALALWLQLVNAIDVRCQDLQRTTKIFEAMTNHRLGRPDCSPQQQVSPRKAASIWDSSVTEKQTRSWQAAYTQIIECNNMSC